MVLTHEQLALFNGRDHHIFDLVLRHYYGHIKLYAYNKVKYEMVADDITIQVFMDLFNFSASFNTEENIKVWLFRRTGNRSRFWQLQEELNALKKEWMEQSTDLDNKDTQLQHHMKVISKLLTDLNQISEKCKQDNRFPERDPVNYWNFAAGQQRIPVNGDATPEEDRGVAKLVSLFAENGSGLEQFRNGGWLHEQSIIYKNIDLDERSKTFWTMVADEYILPVHATPFYPEPVSGKLLTMGFYVRAAIFIGILVGAFCLLSPGKKSNATAGNIVQQPTAANSTHQPNVFKITTVDSFANIGPNRHMSTDEAVNEPLYQKLPIPHGGYIKLDLPDGSRVWLSSMTTFIYPRTFNGNKRKVEITGEAYFEVDSNSAQPFLAIVNGVHVETIGGCFNIKAHEQEAVKKVTVLRGTVTVTAGPYAVRIKENQSALVEKKKRLAIGLNEDTDKETAWRDKRFVFKNDSLAVVARELARRYNLVLAGNINSGALISYDGSRLEPIETVLVRMQQRNRNFMYTIADRVLTIE